MTQVILIVDDCESIHKMVKAILGSEKVAFESVFRGPGAQQAASILQPDLILLDVDMPEMNGFDVCRFLKADPSTWRIPVIFLTASSSTDEKVCGFDLRAVDYITKPFQPAELVSRVRAALRVKTLLDLLPPPRFAAAMASAETHERPDTRVSLAQLTAARAYNSWSRKPPDANARH